MAGSPSSTAAAVAAVAAASAIDNNNNNNERSSDVPRGANRRELSQNVALTADGLEDINEFWQAAHTPKPRTKENQKKQNRKRKKKKKNQYHHRASSHDDDDDEENLRQQARAAIFALSNPQENPENQQQQKENTRKVFLLREFLEKVRKGRLSPSELSKVSTLPPPTPVDPPPPPKQAENNSNSESNQNEQEEQVALVAQLDKNPSPPELPATLEEEEEEEVEVVASPSPPPAEVAIQNTPTNPEATPNKNDESPVVNNTTPQDDSRGSPLPENITSSMKENTPPPSPSPRQSTPQSPPRSPPRNLPHSPLRDDPLPVENNDDDDDDDDDDDLLPPPPPSLEQNDTAINERPVSPLPENNNKNQNDDDDHDQDDDDDDKEGPGFEMQTPSTPTQTPEPSDKEKKRKQPPPLSPAPSTPASILRPKRKRNQKQKQLPKRSVAFAPRGIQSGPLEYEVIPVSDCKDPPPPPGLRRSRRARVKPLAFWKNERPIYGAHDEDGDLGDAMGAMSVVHGYSMALPTPYKLRRVKKTRANNRDGRNGKRSRPDFDDDELTPFNDGPLRKKYRVFDGEEANIWDENSGDATEMKVVCYSDTMAAVAKELPLSAKRKKSEGNVVGNAAQSFNVPNEDTDMSVGYVMGNLVLPPRGIKDPESTGVCTQVFTVCSCQPRTLEVAYGDPEEENLQAKSAQRFLLSSGDHFRVPPGNAYRLENHSKVTECLLSWTIIRPKIDAGGSPSY